MATDTMQKSVSHYENMRDSGIEWIGAVPSDWSIYTLGQLAIQVKNKNLQLQENNLLSLSYGKIKRKNIETKEGLLPASFDNYNIIDAGDIVLRLTDLQNDHTSLRVGLATEKGIITSAYVTLRPKNLALPAFMYYVLHAFDIRKGFYGMGAGVRQGLKFEEIRQIKLCVPSPDVQQDIVDYLNQKCALIESFIVDAKTSIEEYKAWKSSIIYEAVTKGLNPNVEMKDSGIEWIGKIPKHWCDINPKALFSQRKEKARPEDKQLTSSQQYGILFQKEYMELTGSKVVVVEKDFNILKHVENGDFVISMRSFQGGLEYSTKSGCISSAYVMLIPNLKLVYPRYFRWLFKSSSYIQALQSTSDLIRDGQAMRYSNFSQVRLIQVPLCEQETIANYLDKKCTKIDDLIAEKQRLIEDLEAYKKSIIYEVVTGKRKIC